jgi:hypothetical protein
MIRPPLEVADIVRTYVSFRQACVTTANSPC